MIKFFGKRLTTFCIVMFASLLLSSSVFSAASSYSGIVINQGSYDYAPSVMSGDGSQIKMWFCGNAGGDGIFYSTLSVSGWSTPVLVMSKSASGWDSAHVCDPSVVKGTFSYNGTNYSYAMYYTGTYDAIGYDSHIGVAFSNNGTTWVKNAANPVISPGGNASKLYGAGMQSAYRATGTNANVTLAYYDNTLAANNVFMVTSTNGLTFGARTQLPNPIGNSAMGDIAFSASENKWYIATKNMNDEEAYIFKSSGSALTSTWAEWSGRLTATLTGNFKNHNPGFIRKPNGDIYSEATTGYKFIYFGTGAADPNTWGIGQAILTDGWEFNLNGNREGWTTFGMTSTNPSSGLWTTTASGADPQWVSPAMNMWYNYKTVQVRIANQNANTSGRVYFKTNAENYFSEDKSVGFTVANNGTWNTYSISMAGNAKWNNVITGLRIDPIAAGSNQPLGIDFIRMAP